MSASTGGPATPRPPMPPSRGAAHVVSLQLDNHRIVTNPMEPRGGVGHFDPASGRYTLHVSSQNIHINRDHAARALGVEPADVRFVAPDVGGGFGAKNFVYAEHALVPWAAQADRPAGEMDRQPQRGVPGRPSAARDIAAEAALALDAEGRFLALRVTSVANLGAYMIGRRRRRCRPTSTSICRARCIASRRSRCTSWRC